MLWVGIGCQRGVSQTLIEFAIEQVCYAHHLSPAAIAGIATLDLKANEIGLQDLCRTRKWPLRCFSAEVLQQIAVPHPSDVVAAAMGLPSVAEAAAIAAASDGTLPILRVAKQVVRHPNQSGAVTVAIAQTKHPSGDQRFSGIF
jgi:cobalt-precorrin 5A hydrolase/precorrin-3B C17-methyltransferase